MQKVLAYKIDPIQNGTAASTVTLFKKIIINSKIKIKFPFGDLHIRKTAPFQKSVAGKLLCSKKAKCLSCFNIHQEWSPGKHFGRPAWKPAPKCAFGDVDSPQSHPLAVGDRIRDNF